MVYFIPLIWSIFGSWSPRRFDDLVVLMASQMLFKQVLINVSEYFLIQVKIGHSNGKWALDNHYWKLRRLFFEDQMYKNIEGYEWH